MVETYEHNDRITFRARVTSTSEANVFVCPYGFGVRFKILKLQVYNEAGSATVLKFFDHIASGAPTDPAAFGDATTPIFNVSIPTVAHTFIGQNEMPKWNFAQGLAVVASQGTVIIDVEVIEV